MKVVIHICCGVCAAAVVERLISEGHQVLGLFYNPNIYPHQEYSRRLETAYKVARELNFPLEAVPYVPEEWFQAVNGLEAETEGGKRCQVCFRHRLKKAYLYMKDGGLEAFTTTLTISPHKSSPLINQIGQEIGGESFLIRDFKKKGGFRRAVELSHKFGLYQQDYCGCLYSIQKKKAI